MEARWRMEERRNGGGSRSTIRWKGKRRDGAKQRRERCMRANGLSLPLMEQRECTYCPTYLWVSRNVSRRSH